MPLVIGLPTPQPTEQRCPSGSWSEAKHSGSSSLLTQAFSWPCVCKWQREMVTDHIRIKAGKVFGFILRRLSEKRKPQILSFFKAEQQSSEPMERITKWNLEDWAGCMYLCIGCNDNHHVQEAFGLRWAKSKCDYLEVADQRTYSATCLGQLFRPDFDSLCLSVECILASVFLFLLT